MIIVQDLHAVGSVGTEMVFQQKLEDGTEIILKVPHHLLSEELGIHSDHAVVDLIIEPGDSDQAKVAALS